MRIKTPPNAVLYKQACILIFGLKETNEYMEAGLLPPLHTKKHWLKLGFEPLENLKEENIIHIKQWIKTDKKYITKWIEFYTREQVKEIENGTNVGF